MAILWTVYLVNGINLLMWSKNFNVRFNKRKIISTLSKTIYGTDWFYKPEIEILIILFKYCFLSRLQTENAVFIAAIAIKYAWMSETTNEVNIIIYGR